jgi:hypothetical protein
MTTALTVKTLGLNGDESGTDYNTFSACAIPCFSSPPKSLLKAKSEKKSITISIVTEKRQP